VIFARWRCVTGRLFPARQLNKTPVTYDAFSLSSQTIACATSSGWPPRCIGSNDFTRSTAPVHRQTHEYRYRSARTHAVDANTLRRDFQR
jgi:hypothetical protein